MTRFTRILGAGVGLGAISLVIVLGIRGATNKAEGASSGGGKSSLPVSTVQMTPADHYMVSGHFSGKVAARRTSEAGFERGGKIERIEVDEGDRVAVGQILARLDVRRLDASRKEVEARRAQAVAQLDEMLAGPRQETIRVARANVEDLKEQLALVELKRDRAQRLLKEQAVPQDTFDEASSDEKQLQARLEAAGQQLDELVSGTRDEQLRAQKGAVDQLDAALALIDVDLEDSLLRAPFDGTIASREMDEGMISAPGQSLFRIVETGSLEARVGVPAGLIGGLELGMERTVDIEGASIRATVKAIVPEVDPATQTIMVVLALPPDAQGVLPGHVVRMAVEIRRNEAGYWLPTTALTRGERGLWTCYALMAEGGADRIVARQVELIHTENDRVFVRGTIEDNDRVVREGTHRVAVGQTVRDLGDAAPGA